RAGRPPSRCHTPAPALHAWVEQSLITPAEVCDDSLMDFGGRLPPGSAGPARDVVFVSYSHRDREWLRRLLVLLDPVVRNRRLGVGADEYTPAGEAWQRAIDGAVARAALGLLLGSGDFLASRFIIEVELPALLERRVRLAPVLVHDCLWEHEPLLD